MVMRFQTYRRLLKDSADFTFTRQRWVESVPVILPAVIILFGGQALEEFFTFDGTWRRIPSVILFYLTTVVFSMAWYRAAATEETVRIDYRLTRSTRLYLKGLIRIILCRVLLILMAVAIWFVLFRVLDIPDPSRSMPDVLLAVAVHILVLLTIRLEFVLVAAAIDRPMELGEALEKSRPVQWALIGAIATIRIPEMLLTWSLPGLATEPDFFLQYLLDALDLGLDFLYAALHASVTAFAYKRAMGREFQDRES